METLVRSFIAVELSDEVHEKLNDFIYRFNLKQVPGIRTVRVENIHLTLKFLGDATKSQLEKVKEVLKSVSTKVPPFSITLAGIGVFPGWQHPRVLWVGVEAPGILNDLFTLIDLNTTPIGFASEGRRFSPHLTLARFSPATLDPSASTVITKIRTLSPLPVFGEMRVNHITLFSSKLQKGGSVYTVLSRHNLSG